MSLAVLALLAALALGRAAGGSLERLGALPLRSPRLVLGAAAAQLLGAVLGGPAHPAGLAVSAALAGAFLVRNRGLRGTGLVALGLTANALVVTVNGAMPVSAEAAGRAGATVDLLVGGEDPRHVLAGPDTRLGLLGDVVPVPLPLRPEVVSPGDVLVAAGLAQLVVAGMTRPLPRAASAQRRPGLQPHRPQSHRPQQQGSQQQGSQQQGRQRTALPPLPGDPATPPSEPGRPGRPAAGPPARRAPGPSGHGAERP